MTYQLVNDDITIRDATGDDMSLVAEMTQELANFQNMPSGPKIFAEELREDGFETKWPLFQCKEAEMKTTRMVVGFAVYYFTYSSWEGKAMFLQNLFVKKSYRRRGVGRMLFLTVATTAVASGCARLDFHVLAWNPARVLYEELGSQNLTETNGASCFTISGDVLKAFSQKTFAMKKLL